MVVLEDSAGSCLGVVVELLLLFAFLLLDERRSRLVFTLNGNRCDF